MYPIESNYHSHVTPSSLFQTKQAIDSQNVKSSPFPWSLYLHSTSPQELYPKVTYFYDIIYYFITFYWLPIIYSETKYVSKLILQFKKYIVTISLLVLKQSLNHQYNY